MILGIFSACEPEDILFEGASIVHFNTTAATIEVLPADVTGKTVIEIGSTVASDQDRTYTITVNEEASTATKGVEFNLSGETVTIPAGTYLGSFEVTTAFDDLPAPPESRVAVLSLAAGDEAAVYNQEVEITLRASCPSALAGMYSVETSGQVGDGSGGQAGPYTTSIESVEVSEVTDDEGNVIPGAYAIEDITAGLYPQIYSIPVVGPSPTTGISFTDLCNVISIAPGVQDNYGDTFVGGGTAAGDSIVIDWSNGYGDTGRSIYKKL